MSNTPNARGGATPASVDRRVDLLPRPQLLFADTHGVTVWLSTLVGFAACIIIGGLFAFNAPSGQAGSVAVVETLYALSLLLLAAVELTSDGRVVLLGAGAVLVLGGVLNLTFASGLGNVALWFLTFIAVYRLPRRRSLLILGVSGVVFAATGVARALLLQRPPGAASDVLGGLALMALLGWIAGQQRVRSSLILRLQASQAQLRAQMAHAEELAAARERARIARDMHDVLAHSLTVLAIQAQATREIVTSDPRRATTMLDEMAGVLHESIAESRRLVGLLREAERTGSEDSPLGARLLTLADRFSARTGVRCALDEHGKPHALSGEQESALQFALQEALTNAFRHGAAPHVWADLAWQPDAVALSIRDDGAGPPVEATASSGGNGLRGMRERASALGGSVTTDARADGGFTVTLIFPFIVVEEASAKEDA